MIEVGDIRADHRLDVHHGRLAEELPPRARILLSAAHEAEVRAVGPERRLAFRLTRIVIGGIFEAGYDAAIIAGALGVSPRSARVRAEAGGELSAATLLKCGAVSPAEFSALTRHGLLGDGRRGTDGDMYYSASAVIRGIAALH